MKRLFVLFLLLLFVYGCGKKSEDIVIPIEFKRTDLWYDLDGDPRIYYKITLQNVDTGKISYIEDDWHYENIYQKTEKNLKNL